MCFHIKQITKKINVFLLVKNEECILVKSIIKIKKCDLDINHLLMCKHIIRKRTNIKLWNLDTIYAARGKALGQQIISSDDVSCNV